MSWIFIERFLSDLQVRSDFIQVHQNKKRRVSWQKMSH
jgi:hypothetical protein